MTPFQAGTSVSHGKILHCRLWTAVSRGERALKPTPRTFPLHDRARMAGVFDGKSALVVAPTATGKSRVGRDAIVAALSRGDHAGDLQAYLVPYRALAEEVYQDFHSLPAFDGARLRILTGDHRDPLQPQDADVVVATYEAFDGMLRRGGVQPGTVVADEIHLLADPTRGPGVEGLLTRLIVAHNARQLVGLSAVVANGDQIAAWLGIPLVRGTAQDRPVELTVEVRVVDDLQEGLTSVVDACRDGEQAIVFCASRGRANRIARELSENIERWLTPDQRQALQALGVETSRIEDPEASHLRECLVRGVAVHHAGLSRELRQRVEEGFRNRWVRVITATPTLAAGVNLPCGIAVVLDVMRNQFVRGRSVQSPLTSGEVLNMLGRAGRPGQAGRGVGVTLVEKRLAADPRVKDLTAAVARRDGGPVASRLPDSFEAMMRFVLTTVVEHGETTPNQLLTFFEFTFARHADHRPIRLDRPFQDDLMEDIPSYQRVIEANGDIGLTSAALSPAGVEAQVASGEHTYTVGITLFGVTCTCQAARYRPWEPCKHVACAIHDILFTDGVVERDVYWRTLFNCGHIFDATLDPGTRLVQATRLLEAWGLLERMGLGWIATPLGRLASTQIFDLLMVRQAAERVRGSGGAAAAPDHRTVAAWAVEDFFADAKVRERWRRALPEWLNEQDYARIKPTPEKYRGDFERRIDDLSRLCTLYGEAAAAAGNVCLATVARQAAGAVRYGVAPELVRLAALSLPQLGRARCRALYTAGIEDVSALAAARRDQVAAQARVALGVASTWIDRAGEIARASADVAAGGEEAAAALDETLSRFRVDAAALWT